MKLQTNDATAFQTSATIIYFTQTLWPEFTFWHFLAGVFYYQRHCGAMNEVKNQLRRFSIAEDASQVTGKTPSKKHQSQNSFLEHFDRRKYEELNKLSKISVELA